MIANARTVASATGVSELGEIRRILRSRIRRFQGQPRTYFDPVEMDELMSSIEEIGQRTPIIVRLITDDPDHDYELIDGERRFIACGKLKINYMLAWVREVEDEEEQYLSSVVANCARSGHTSLEIARAVERMRNSKKLAGLSSSEQVRRIAKSFARTEGWVYQNLGLMERLHPVAIQRMLPEIPEGERLNFSMAVYISSLHPDVQKEIVGDVVEKKMSMNAARYHARQVALRIGGQAGTAKRVSGLPSANARRLEILVRNTAESLRILSASRDREAMRVGLAKRKPEDATRIMSQLDQCITGFTELRDSLLESMTRPAETVESAKEVVTTSKPAPVPAPKSSVQEVTPNVAYQVLQTLFFTSNGQPEVNLSRKRVKRVIPPGRDVDEVVRGAVHTARKYWRVEASGSEPEKKLAKLMHRVRHSYGNPQNYADVLVNIRRRDSSPDPVPF